MDALLSWFMSSLTQGLAGLILGWLTGLVAGFLLRHTLCSCTGEEAFLPHPEEHCPVERRREQST